MINLDSMIWSKLLSNIDIIVKLLGGLAIIFLSLLAKCNGDEATEYLSQVRELREIHSKEVNSKGDTVYITKQEYYTKDDLRNSNDPIIIQLLNEFDNLKLRKVTQMFTTNAHTKIKYNTRTIRDTVVIYRDSLQQVREYEEYSNDILSIKRIKDTVGSSIAHYEYNYNPSLSGAISWKKAGKWKPINIIKWRPKVWSINLVSNDTNMVIGNTKFVYVGKKRN